MDVTDSDDLFAHLEAEMGDVVVPDVEDVTTLDTANLLRRFHGVERDLREKKELLHPRTPAGREHHSRRSAYLIELRRRGIL